jgi:hypothetical protein
MLLGFAMFELKTWITNTANTKLTHALRSSSTTTTNDKPVLLHHPPTTISETITLSGTKTHFGMVTTTTVTSADTTAAAGSSSSDTASADDAPTTNKPQLLDNASPLLKCQFSLDEIKTNLTMCQLNTCTKDRITMDSSSNAFFRVSVLNHPLVETALRIKNSLPHGVVYLQYLDKSYLTLTKNWICNVHLFPTVLARTIFITIDLQAYAGLKKFSKENIESLQIPPLNIIFIEYIPRQVSNGVMPPPPTTTSSASTSTSTTGGLEYGTLPYYDLMLFRTGINYQLLSYNIDIFIIESDMVWHSDPSEIMFNQLGDVIALNDMGLGRIPGITHGFSLWRITRNPKVLQYMARLLSLQENIVRRAIESQRFNIGDEGNEQFHMMNLFNNQFRDIKLTYFPGSQFFNGRRYDEKSDYIHPLVRHNNYVVGNDVKMKRTQTMGFWYLNKENSNELPGVEEGRYCMNSGILMRVGGNSAGGSSSLSSSSSSSLGGSQVFVN